MALNQARACTPLLVRVGLGVVGLCIIGYILGPPLYWHFMEGIAAFSHSSSPACSPCECDCSSQPLLSIPEALSNGSFADCVKHDPEVGEVTEKNYADLLSEELKLREVEALESQRRADMALLEAKKLTSQYQKEADKCNSGMETCEEAREKAEATLAAQKKLTAMWELRARQRGWKEGIAKS
ncbi:uncharacterized protein LOC116204649 [Punica granatum]|uniref:Uncharacterized protein LOC116204649 n=2 Tax=Punica granatum TaxID=22663 RepID=A0A6P8D7V6_PUNGR|nr:uncharacterized protein LOC116204649 [Punica granatum]PKI54368.1 hypothetical protein CRG98_025254 [Punica granatum]